MPQYYWNHERVIGIIITLLLEITIILSGVCVIVMVFVLVKELCHSAVLLDLL